MHRIIGFLFLFLFPVPAAARAQGSDLSAADRARIDSVFAQWDRTNSPGCALGIERGGAMLYQRGYGMANLETGQAITPRSIFHVASISKQFAAASVALLASRGRLSLDDDIRKHVPEVPAYGTPVTIRHLIHHTSGLRDQWTLLRMAGWRQDDLITEDDVLWVVGRQKDVNFKPNDEYLYSNTGYTLLGTIVRRVTGQTLRQFADQEIFRPLGMLETHFHDDHSMVVPGRTSAYTLRNGQWHVSIPDFDTYGATSLFTTVGDLLKWEHNFSTGQVLGRPLLDQMVQPIRLNDGTESSYGFGVVAGRHRGLRTTGHSGADHGYRADVIRFVDHDVSIAAFCNLAQINPSALTRRVGEILLEQHLEPQPVAPVTIALSGKQVERWTGTYYDARTDEVRRFQLRGDSLALVQGPALKPVAEDRFIITAAQPEWRFRAEGSGAVLEIVNPGQPTLRLERQAAPDRTPAALRRYAGEFRSDELDTRWEIAVKDSGLVLKQPKFPDATLTPLFPDAFSLEGQGPLIRFTRGRGNVITGFIVTAGRVRRIRFEQNHQP
jgi:CubicO group peptidase (beta-lactamase class C family)